MSCGIYSMPEQKITRKREMFVVGNPGAQCPCLPFQQGAQVSLAAVREMLAATTKAGRVFPSLNLLSSAAPLVEYSVNVTNTGSVEADDVVLG